ncbi:uncharacterized protein LOC143905895 [Temnothorax americanus]|uniref:uncharacterized protein LOC143905895 n=1 Tax=Temnothorax americanus TaxID=1964332 RepID=UPI0040679DB8
MASLRFLSAWERVTTKYCSQGFPPRTSKQLKKCWDNMKQKKKKLNTSMKVQRLMTGGGVSPAVPVDPVMDFMDTVTPNLDIEVPCPFDSTAQFEKEYHIKSNSKRQLISDNEDDDSILIASNGENVPPQVAQHRENSTGQYSKCNVNKIVTSGTMKKNQIPASKIQNTAQFEKEYHIKSNLKRQLISSEDEDSISITSDGENVLPQVAQHRENSTGQYSKCSSSSSATSKFNVDKIATSGMKKNQIPASKIQKNFQNINDEKELRLIKLREAIEQQRELHSMKMKVAETEVKIALLKLSMTEEKVQMQSESSVLMAL